MGSSKGFLGHFVNAANPRFVLDASNVPLTPTAQADVREPISSSCTANPFNADGAACQGAPSERRSSCSPTGRARAACSPAPISPAR